MVPSYHIKAHHDRTPFDVPRKAAEMSSERIIHGERDAAEHWVAWFVDTPQGVHGGCTSAEALSRVLRTLPAKAVWWNITRTSDQPGNGEDQFEVVVRFEPCPDCGGSGQYVGLNAIEDCRSCGGRG